MKRLLFVYGTRPEAVKMAPLILEFRKHPSNFEIKVCLTGQHRHMLDQVNSFFGIQGDYDLDLMLPNQTLAGLTSRCILGIDLVIDEAKPDYIFVQGDTTTVIATALAAYYKHVPVVHIEAGLRSGDKYSPFPEEINRILTGHLAEWHFAPTESACSNLAREGIFKNVYVVGNTVIDAILFGLDIINNNNVSYAASFQNVNFSRRIILVTGHRRESFGEAFENMCLAIKDIAEEFTDTELVYPVHLNPNVQEPVRRILSGTQNIHLIDPLEYPRMIWLMNQSYLVLTDSGGIQEEAPALGKPVLVMRDVTERQEGVDAGTSMLVGSDRGRIYTATKRLLTDQCAYDAMSRAINPYGLGDTSKRIVAILSAAQD